MAPEGAKGEGWWHLRPQGHTVLVATQELLQATGESLPALVAIPSLSTQVVTRLIHLLSQKILGNLQQLRGPFPGGTW